MIDVLSPISGSVWMIEKRPGDEVREGDMIMILESMKMEFPVTAPCNGTVQEVRVGEADLVEEGTVVATIST